MKIAYVADTSISFKKDMFTKIEDVYFMHFILTDVETQKEYIDNRIELNQKIAEKYAKTCSAVKTSQPKAQEINNIIIKLFDEKKYDNIVFFTLNRKFSGTYNTVLSIVNQLPTKLKERIFVYDSQNYLLRSIIDFCKIFKGKFKTLEDIKKYCNSLLNSETTCGLFCNFEKAKSSGRFHALFLIIMLGKLKLKIAFYFSRSKNNLSLLSVSRGFKRSTAKIYKNLIEKSNKKAINSLVVYYSFLIDEKKKLIEESFKLQNPNIQFTYIQFPLIFAAVLGEQYAFDIFDDEMKDVYTQYGK